jgi:hypothetical protein
MAKIAVKAIAKEYFPNITVPNSLAIKTDNIRDNIAVTI